MMLARRARRWATQCVVAIATSAALIACTEATAPASRTPVSSPPELPASVASIAVEPTVVTLHDGDSLRLRVVARDAAGRELAGRVPTFITADQTVASVAADGTVHAVAPGQTSIRVRVGGRETTAAVNVTTARVASVTITPGALLLEVGETVPLQVNVRDSRGRVMPEQRVTWSVDPQNVSISADGMLRALRAGYATISATVDGVQGATAATVTPMSDYPYDLLFHRNSGSTFDLFSLSFGSDPTPSRINVGVSARTPSASPDGMHVAFSSIVTMNATRTEAIFVASRDGRSVRRLTTMPGTNDQPAWSPVGGRIAWHHADDVSGSGVGRSDIWVMDEVGAALVNLTADMSRTAWRRSPAWSADGAWIAFVEVESNLAGSTTSIWAIRADGGEKRRLTSTTTGFDANPSWSPDGTRLVFTRYFDGDADLVIHTVSTGAIRRLPQGGQQFSPVWSPLGDLIAAVHVPEGAAAQLVTVQPNGRRFQLRTLDPSWGGGASPVWSRR
jgi:hypothetical protein